jgi:hypothetical protein
MNRRERRLMDRMTKKEFERVRDYTLKQLKKQYPDYNVSKEEIEQAEQRVKDIIKIEQQFK